LNVYHPKVTASLWLTGMLVIGIFSIQALAKDWLETGFLALLPAGEQNPEIAKAVRQHNERLNRKVIWLAGAATSQQAIMHARRIKPLLEHSKLFNNVVLQFPEQRYIEQHQQLFPYRYQLLDAKTRLMLDKNPRDLIRQALEILYSPMGQMQAATLERDPLSLFSRYFSSQNPFDITVEQGVVILHDATQFWALLLTDLEDNNLQLDKLENLLNLVNSATAQVRAEGGEVMASGMPLFTAYGAQSAKQEISTVGLGSSAGIILLLLMVFRSVRPIVLSALAIGSGLFAAWVITILFFGKIHILTLVFGASLIGVADDYAQHFLCDSLGEKQWSPQKGLHFILPGLAIGLLSNLLSYAGLGFSPFPGLQEVALFSAIGLLVAWLTVVLLFPWLLTGFKFHHKPGLLRLTTYWEQEWPVWVSRNRRLLSGILVFFIIGGLWQLTPQDDVRLLQSVPVELTDTANKIRDLFPLGQDSQFFLVSGKGYNDWYENEQQLLNSLEALKQHQALKHYEGVSAYWPNANRQQENYRLLKRTLYDSGLIKQYMTELGFNENAINTELKQFINAEGRELALPDWLKTTDETRQTLWLGCQAERCQSRVSLTGINDLPALALLERLQGVQWVDQVDQLSTLFKRYRIRASGLLVVAYSLVLIGLGLKFGWRQGLSILSVPVLSLAVALATLGWFGQLFSLFNLFALLLVLGIGVDYAMFFFMAGDRRASTSLAVTLSALTTLLAFGLLAISATQMVHAFGFTVATGIVTALLIAPLVNAKAIVQPKTPSR
jgi:predicted exporter